MAGATKMTVEDLVDMTAMVDIVFFVLIFFMVTSMEGVYSSIDMPSPDPQKVATSGKRSVNDFESDKEYVVVRIDKRQHPLGQRHRSRQSAGASDPPPRDPRRATPRRTRCSCWATARPSTAKSWRCSTPAATWAWTDMQLAIDDES